jgi:glyoxylase-like metal-dependent hydrolase (beta-lactamase superfamily II)
MTSRECTEVAGGVFVMTSVRYTTTSTMVCRGQSAVLVDPAWTVSELDAIRDWLDANGRTVTCGVTTHAHHDHMLWHPEFGDAPRWASMETARLATEWHDELFTMLDDDYRESFPDPLRDIAGVSGDRVPTPFGNDANSPDEPFELVVHAGHAPGHTAIWLPERGVMLAGDMLSDIELPLPFNPDDLPAYLDALDLLAPVVARADVLVPGHGHVTDRPIERLDADRSYLDAVIRGDDPDDPRRALPGMAEAHDKIVELARQAR